MYICPTICGMAKALCMLVLNGFMLDNCCENSSNYEDGVLLKVNHIHSQETM